MGVVPDETDWKLFVADADDPESEHLRSMADVGEHRVRRLPSPESQLAHTISEQLCTQVNEIREWFRLYKTAEGKGENRFGMNERVADAVFAANVVGVISSLTLIDSVIATGAVIWP